MTKKLERMLILGAGGHGHVVAETAQTMNSDIEIAFLDDNANISNSRWPILGPLATAFAGALLRNYSFAFCGLGDNKKRALWHKKLAEFGYETPSLIHSNAWISPTARVGKGTIICAGVVINARTTIGDNAILNTSCSIDHDCQIGWGAHVAPGSHLAGRVFVGNGVFIGAGATIIQDVSIGENSCIGAGAVVLNNIPPNSLAFGVPAKRRT